jgi:hypothetical protein
MTTTNLIGVAEQVVARAQSQGSIEACDVREELVRAGQPESFWKDVLALARPSLSYRDGRYYYSAPVSERVRAEQSQQRDIQSAVIQIIENHQAVVAQVERREKGRIDFIQPVKVITEDNRTLTLLSRDLSTTGIRLLGTCRLLGQKVRVQVSLPTSTLDFQVRILWTCPVTDDLVENGGTFLSVSTV